MKLSLCMIVKNEEEVLHRCLSSTQDLFDEIIIVDTGSTDNTKKIARSFTSKIYNFKWVDDFSLARNFSFSKATGDYIMWLDADDVISLENLEKLKTLKQNLDPSVNCYMLNYALSFNEQNQPTFIFKRERIVKNNSGFYWEDPVHETIKVTGKIEHAEIDIYHQKIKKTPINRNLKIYEKLIESGKQLNARQKFYYARELFYNSLYNKTIEHFEDYLKNYNGWIENKIEAHLMLGNTFLIVQQPQKSLETYFKSFELDVPRSEILCEIANIFMLQKNYNQTIYWATLALKNKPNINSGAFVLPESYHNTPNLLLCIAHYNLGSPTLAKKFNDKVLKQNPKHPSALINKSFFENLAKQKQNRKSTI